MNKKLVLTLVSLPLLVTLLAVPTYCDFTEENETSVTDDLNKLSYDYEDLQDYTKTTLLTMAISDNKQVFAYFFEPNGSADSYYNVSRISFTDSAETNGAGEYLNECNSYDLDLISRDTDKELSKYVIDDFTLDPDKEYYRLYCDNFTSQYYFNNGTSHEGEIIYSYTEVLYDLKDLEYVTNKIKIITITDKIVSFDTISRGGGVVDAQYWTQASYVAFNTDYAIEDLVKIDVGYHNTFLTGDTTLNCNDSAASIGFYDVFSGYTDFKNGGTVEGTNYVRKYIEPESFSYDTGGFGLFIKNQHYEWNTIQKVSDLDNASDAVKNYQWLVHFQKNGFDTGKYNFSFQYIIGKQTTDLDDASFDYPYFSYVTDFKIFNLWFRENGETKQAAVIDTPTDSSGHEPSTDPDPVIGSWLDNFMDWFKNNLPQSIVYVIVGGLAIISTAMAILVEIPKALIKWLFGTRRK